MGDLQLGNFGGSGMGVGYYPWDLKGFAWKKRRKRCRTFRVILFSIHNDEWKSFQSQHKQLCEFGVYNILGRVDPSDWLDVHKCRLIPQLVIILEGEMCTSESLSPQVVSAAKLPILNPNEFDLWKMRIEQYFLMTDYSLWEVILNARKNELKAHGNLLMALPDKHQLKFNTHKDAKTLMKRNKTDSTNEPVSAAASVSIVSTKIPVTALPNVDSLSNA
nr:ribonuclease H-like domain-containing protein [Tanacetum cinerariifolium]